MPEAPFTISYQGPGYSTNKALSQGPWQRRKTKQEYQEIFYEKIDKLSVKSPIEKYTVLFRFNARIETSNNHMLEKILVDCLRYRGIVVDDANKNLREVIFRYDPTLAKNTFEVTITPE
ncbi:MAG: hypothetical protein EOO61_01295 [Hymenobacter sp.]|nr:MAG: hypothetical protein EOO61_01295 [Hymenobacter sp.]